MQTHDTAAAPASGTEGAALENFVTTLPVTSFSAGETILAAGSKSGRLLFLKSGAVKIAKGSVEIATVREPGAVLGEISALLDRPHSADVRALEDSQFYAADASLIGKDPIAVLFIARILARRLVAADEALVELKDELQPHAHPALHKLIEKIEGILMIDTFAEVREMETQAQKRWPALSE